MGYENIEAYLLRIAKAMERAYPEEKEEEPQADEPEKESEEPLKGLAEVNKEREEKKT